MGKLLSWVILIALAYLAFKLVAIGQRKREAAQRARHARESGSADGDGTPRRVSGEMMVRCAHCGVFLPASDALIEGDRAWCDRAHRDADRAGQPRE